MSDYRNRNVTRRIALVGMLIALSALVVASKDRAIGAPLDTITLRSPNNVTIAESADYATQEMADPWDMNNLSDIKIPIGYGAPSVSNGIWNGTTDAVDALLHLQFQSFPDGGIYNYLGETNGVNYPIDTSRYTHLQVRLKVDRVGPLGSVVFFFLPNSPTPAGNSPGYISISVI